MKTNPKATDGRAPAHSHPMPELEAGLVQAAAMLHEFYAGLEARRVSAATPSAEIEALFADTLGEEGVGVQAALRDAERWLMPHAMTVPHPLYLGLINSSPMAGGIVAESLIAGLNNNSGSWIQGPPFMAAEQEVVRCFRQLLGMPEETTGIVLPGGSYASLHGLQLARESRLPQWRKEGARALSGDPRVYVSSASHFSAARSAMALGVADRDVVSLPTLGRGHIDARALAAQLREDKARGALPFALVATLGSTGTGAIDHLGELSELCREFGLWLHVDACYGGAGALVQALGSHFEGLAEADSVAVDPHKWFFIPMVAGLLLTRHTEFELGVFDIDASYIPTGEFVDSFRRSLTTSRRGSAFAIWMALRAHGLQSVRTTVERNIALTRRLEAKLAAEGLRVMPAGELSVACARWEPAGHSAQQLDALQGRIAAEVSASGEAWFGCVRAQGQTWLRFNLVNLYTRKEHIDDLASRLGERLRNWV